MPQSHASECFRNFAVSKNEYQPDMGRIMAIDYGRKRCGIAVTDELQLIANGLTTVRSHDVFDFLTNYLAQEMVETIVIGEPKDMQNNPSEAARYIEPFVNRLKKAYPELAVQRFDERFTSVMAFQSMIDAGLSKKKRQDKSLVDTISATLILQSYMESQKNQRK
jgi:putative Holliday junction resolvase